MRGGEKTSERERGFEKYGRRGKSKMEVERERGRERQTARKPGKS